MQQFHTTEFVVMQCVSV